jgi:hypothetical protein
MKFRRPVLAVVLSLASWRPVAAETAFAQIRPTTDSGVGTIAVDEKSNMSRIQASPGQVIELTLHSTYWHLDGSSADSVVSQTGESWVKAAPRKECLPGMGCGTAGASFTARRPGTAQIRASRVSCGEAMACPPEQRLFVVTVVVR